GVIYNSARIALSERARDLASLRVLGFTRGEVLRILLLELAVLTLIAQPPGWAMGYGLAWMMKTNLAGELMRVRLVVEPFTYAMASVIVIVAAGLSALIVGRRVSRLDLVAVLKTRDCHALNLAETNGGSRGVGGAHRCRRLDALASPHHGRSRDSDKYRYGGHCRG